jgi:hypothetical protein
MTLQKDKDKLLKEWVQQAIASRSLDGQKHLIQAIAAELNASVLECAAAIVFLNEEGLFSAVPDKGGHPPYAQQELHRTPVSQTGFRLVRYRLDLGNQHSVTLEQIKKVLVEESGVDVKNISNVRIMDCYTLIDLPDEMPQEIFHHLKAIEINGQKLDIRRVKPRNKKRNNRKHRHARPGMSTIPKEAGY